MKTANAPDVFQRTKTFTCYVAFIVTYEGKIQNVHAYEKDQYGLYKIAIDIVKNCRLEFIPGEIDGKRVSSECYMPIDFEI